MNSNTALTETVFYILLTLTKPLHGYGIMQEISALTDGRLNLGAGTLYGALKNLQKKGWISEVDSPPDSRDKRAYVITNEGREALTAEIDRLAELIDNAHTVLKGVAK